MFARQTVGKEGLMEEAMLSAKAQRRGSGRCICKMAMTSRRPGCRAVQGRVCGFGARSLERPAGEGPGRTFRAKEFPLHPEGSGALQIVGRAAVT